MKKFDLRYLRQHFWNYFWRVPPFSFLYRGLYRARISWPVWHHVLNRRARRLFQTHPFELNTVQEQAVSDLKKDGIAVLHFKDLFPERDFREFQSCGNAYAALTANETRIQKQAAEQGTSAKKYYLVPFWQSEVLDLQNPFMQLGLDDAVLGIVCTYLERFCRITYMDLWYSVPMNTPPRYSQRWHRDPDDRRLVKLFLYLDDVDDIAGPFCYIPGSHDLGPYRNHLPSRPPYSTYPKEGEVEKYFLAEKIRICTGKAGTIVLCDTKGLHKGGHATGRRRFLFNAVYLTDGGIPSEKKKMNYLLLPGSSERLRPAARYAVGLAGEARAAAFKNQEAVPV